MSRCIEPGCPFEAAPDGNFAYASYPSEQRTLPADGRCYFCRGEPRCAFCTNVAQRGRLCRVCASSRAPGQGHFAGEWLPHRLAIVELMRRPELAGVKWAREGDRIVGRLDVFVISLKVNLWAPLPAKPENDL